MANKCFLCGSLVNWDVDFTFADYGLDGDGVVSEYSCTECGAMYSVYKSFDEESEAKE